MESSRIWDAEVDGVGGGRCHMVAMSSGALKNLGEVEEKEQKRRSWWISSCGESGHYF